MDKSKQKSQTVWNTEAISIVAKRWDFSKRYIKEIILGEKSPVTAERIQKEYKLVCHNLNAMKEKETINKQ